MGELSGQAREATGERPSEQARAAIVYELDHDIIHEALDDAGTTDTESFVNAILTVTLPDGRSVGEWLDEAAVMERLVVLFAQGRIQDFGAAWGGWMLGDGDPLNAHIGLADADPEAAIVLAALLARLGSGGGVPDGEGDRDV